MDVDSSFDELGRESKRLWRCVRVLEAAGVGDERDVERLGDLRCQVDVELEEDVADDLAGRRRVSDDEVDLPEPCVVVVVVDIERERNRVEQRRGCSHALRVRAVERNEHACRRVLGQLTTEAVERQERVLGRRVGVAAEVHDAVLSERVQAELHAENRAERVAVRVLVRDEQEAVVLP